MFIELWDKLYTALFPVLGEEEARKRSDRIVEDKQLEELFSNYRGVWKKWDYDNKKETRKALRDAPELFVDSHLSWRFEDESQIRDYLYDLEREENPQAR